jgi:hypothetical protein
MTTVAPDTPLEHWPANATLAYRLDDGAETVELVLTNDGQAILDGRSFIVGEQVRVAERRSGLAKMHAGKI